MSIFSNDNTVPGLFSEVHPPYTLLVVGRKGIFEIRVVSTDWDTNASQNKTLISFDDPYPEQEIDPNKCKCSRRTAN